jgi:hypothetical protein
MDLITLGKHFIRSDKESTMRQIRDCFNSLGVIYTPFSGGYDGTVIHQHHFIEIQLSVFEKNNEFIFEIRELTRTYSAYDDFLSQFSDYMQAGFPKKRSFSPPPIYDDVPPSVCTDIMRRLTSLNGAYESLHYAKKRANIFTQEFISHYENLLRKLTDEEEQRACLISIIRVIPAKLPKTLTDLITHISHSGSEHAKRQALMFTDLMFTDRMFTTLMFAP